MPRNASALKSGVDTVLQTVLPFFGLLVALLMVSRIRYPHITNRVLRGQRSFGHVVAVVFCFVAIDGRARLCRADRGLCLRRCTDRFTWHGNCGSQRRHRKSRCFERRMPNSCRRKSVR